MKLSAFSPDSVGDGFLAVQEQMSVGDFLAALLVSLAAAAAASLLYRFFYERRGTGSQIHRAFPLLSLAVTPLVSLVTPAVPFQVKPLLGESAADRELRATLEAEGVDIDSKTRGLAGYVYTQLSDIEEEMNGLLTYDRRVNKMLE